MKIIIEVTNVNNDKISEIYFPSIDRSFELPEIPLKTLDDYLEKNIYNKIIYERNLLKKVLSFDFDSYLDKNKLIVFGEIQVEKALGFLPGAMPWFGRFLLFATFIVASISSFLATVSQGDEGNFKTAMAIIGVVISLLTLPALYRYSRAEATYQSMGLRLEDLLNKAISPCYTSEKQSITSNNLLLENDEIQNTTCCTFNNLAPKTITGVVLLIAALSLIIQYIEYSSGLLSLNDNAARNNAPHIPLHIMPTLAVIAGVFVAIHKTTVETSFLYRGAKDILSFFSSKNKKVEPNERSSLVIEDYQDTYSFDQLKYIDIIR